MDSKTLRTSLSPLKNWVLFEMVVTIIALFCAFISLGVTKDDLTKYGNEPIIWIFAVGILLFILRIIVLFGAWESLGFTEEKPTEEIIAPVDKLMAKIKKKK